jgi:hypothetical protein
LKTKQLTFGLLGTIAGEGSQYLILLSSNAVFGALTVATLPSRGLILCLGRGTLLSAALLHARSPESATKRLLQVAFRVVELGRGLAVESVRRRQRRRLRRLYLGWDVPLSVLFSVMIL